MFWGVLNFILSIQATERNKQKKGKKKPANTLFNPNGVSDSERCGSCVLSWFLKCFIACVSQIFENRYCKTSCHL